LLLEQLAHEFHGCLIAPSLDQQIEDLAFVVDRAPLLAGVSQTITNPDTLNAVRDETILAQLPDLARQSCFVSDG